jgi:hypothetical protein
MWGKTWWRMFFGWGSGVSIIIEDLRKKLRLLISKPVPYTLRMADQTLTKLIRLTWNLKIHIHGIPYVVTFIVMKNNVLNASNSMLLGCPWLRDVKVTHDWGNNLISIDGNGTIRTIAITKHLDSNTKCLQVLLCYGFVNRVTNEEENVLLANWICLQSASLLYQSLKYWQ